MSHDRDSNTDSIHGSFGPYEILDRLGVGGMATVHRARERGIEGFHAVVVSPDLSTGIEALIQSHGLGSLRPNTILLGWPMDP